MPSPNGTLQRAPGGRFAPGNKAGRGNPHGPAQQRFRARLFAAMDDETFDRIVQVLIERATAGEPWAVRELLDRLLGKASQTIEVEGVHRIDVAAVWTANVENLIALALTCGMVDQLPERFRAMALAQSTPE